MFESYRIAGRLAALCLLMLPFAALCQNVTLVYDPNEPPREYTDNFHDTAIKPRGAYGLASFEVNPWLYDQRTHTAYRFMETTGHCALIAVFKDYMTFVENQRRCLPIETSGTALRIVDVLTIANRYLLVYALHDTEQQRNTVYIQELDTALNVTGEAHELITLKEFADNDLTLVRVSPNQRYIAVLHGDPDYSFNKNHRRPECFVFNNTLTPVWQNAFDFSAYDGLLADIELDDAGNLHILRGPITRDFAPGMHSYFWRTDRTVNTPLGRQDNTNVGCKLRIIHGVATVAGFYRERRTMGYFIYQADTVTQTVTQADRVKLTDQHNLSRNLVIRDIVTLPSGDLIFSAEWDVCSVHGAQTLCMSGPITVIAWQGKHHWQHTLYKDQTATEGGRGYTMIPCNNTVLFIYNDHPDNLLKPTADTRVKRYHGKPSVVVVHQLTTNGKATKELLRPSRTGSPQRIIASGMPPIIPGRLYKVKVLEGDKMLNGVLDVTP